MPSKLNEDLMRTNLDLPEGEIKIEGKADPVYADAINVHEKKKKELETNLKDNKKAADDFIKSNDKTQEITSPDLKKMKLSEELFEDFNEQLQDEDEDGWGDDVEEALDEFFDKADAIAYEVRHCVRGTYAIRGDKIEDLVSNLQELSSMLDDAISYLDNQEDELNEATAVLDRPVNKSKKFGDKVFSTDYIYKAKRDPLVDIIQDELTSGETVYRMGDDGKLRPTFAPSLNINYEDIGAASDSYGEYVIANVADEAMVKQVEAIGHKYGKEVKNGYDKYVSDTPYWVKIYINDADWDEPYVDPNVKTIKDIKK